MSSRLSVLLCLVLATVVIPTGCQHNQKEDVVVLDREPNLATIHTPFDYEARAIEAVGGLNAWTRLTKIQFDSVVTYFRPDGSYYLTKQEYIFYPWSNSIEILGRESQGNFTWRLSPGQFEVMHGSRRTTNMMSPIDNQCFAEAILNIVTAPVRLLDNSVEFTKDTNPIKIQGQWRYPIVRRHNNNIESILRIPKAVFYQNRDTSIIDMLSIACLGVDQFLIIRGYYYSKMREGDIVIPHKIEMFLSDSQGYSQKRLAKIDYN